MCSASLPDWLNKARPCPLQSSARHWLDRALPTAPLISGHSRLSPSSASSPSVSFPLSSIALPMSLFCPLFLSSLVLSIYPSVPISQEARPINLFKQPSEHLIHFTVAVWERASSLSQDPNARDPLPSPACASTSPPILLASSSSSLSSSLSSFLSSCPP